MEAPAQSAFAAALCDAAAPLPPGLASWNGSDVGQRFAIYRNNVAVSLMEALAAKFPVVAALVGAEFFRAMARVFVAAHPPKGPILAEYGAEFPDFIAAFPPAGGLPYLADTARLEAACLAAFHAADAPALGAGEFAAVPTEALADLRLAPHPAARLVRARFAIASLWAAHQPGGEIGAVDPLLPEDALVTRGEDGTLGVVALVPGVAAALAALAAGRTLAEALADSAAEVADFDPSLLFQTLIASPFACAILPSTPEG